MGISCFWLRLLEGRHCILWSWGLDIGFFELLMPLEVDGVDHVYKSYLDDNRAI